MNLLKKIKAHYAIQDPPPMALNTVQIHKGFEIDSGKDGYRIYNPKLKSI